MECASVDCWNILFENDVIYNYLCDPENLINNTLSNIVFGGNEPLLKHFVDNVSTHPFYAHCVSSFIEKTLIHISLSEKIKLILKYIYVSPSTLCVLISHHITNANFKVAEIYMNHLKGTN
jgi:hypothetical protein